MVVTVHAAQAVAATDAGATFVIADGGANATGVNALGGITISAGDFNPERLEVYAGSGVNASFRPAYVVGDQLGDVTGVIGYFGGNYELIATSVGNTASSQGGIVADEVTKLRGDAQHMTFAEYNVENLDPNDTTFEALAYDITANLGSPDVIALEEIQDYNGNKLDAGQTDFSGTATLTKLVLAIQAAGGGNYAFVEVAPTANGSTGGEPNGNIHNAFIYRTDRVSYVDGSARLVADPTPANGNAYNNSRQPLAADFVFNSQTVTTIAVHNYSRLGSDQLFGANQPPVDSGTDRRNDQTQVLHDYIVQLQVANPDARIVVAGDFNGFGFEQSLLNLEAGGSLTNLARLIDSNERYSAVFEGNSQQLDHILVSGSLLDQSQFDVVHLNSGQLDPTSDHDPTIAQLFVARPTLAGLSASSSVVVGDVSTNDTFVGTADAQSFYISTLTSGRDVVTQFGPEDTLILDQKLYDSNNDGIVTFQTYKTLSLEADGSRGDTIDLVGVDPRKGVRFLGEKDGHFVYESASVRPVGAQESGVGNDTMVGTSGADVFLFNTALGLNLGSDTIRNFGSGDRIVTTSKVYDWNNDGFIGFGNDGVLDLPSARGGTAGDVVINGTVGVTGTNGQMVGKVEYLGDTMYQGVHYYLYGLEGSAHNTALTF